MSSAENGIVRKSLPLNSLVNVVWEMMMTQVASVLVGRLVCRFSDGKRIVCCVANRLNSMTDIRKFAK